MRGFIIIPILISVFIIFLPLFIGIYVYNDAKSRNMNALLWMLIAMLVPTYLGLLAYLIVRNDYENLHCSACNYPIKSNYTSCPNCGVSLKAQCEHCHRPVDPSWSVCPYCSERLNHMGSYRAPISQPKSSFPYVLVTVIGLFLLLFIILAVVFTVSRYH